MPGRDHSPVAVLYQAAPAPVIDGMVKPYKPGGYADSGADIAFALTSRGIPVITPVARPHVSKALDWVFPDTDAGIETARRSGASALWANTVLFAGHPLAAVLDFVRIIGHHPSDVERFDDKWNTNELLRSAGLPVVSGILADLDRPTEHVSFPVIVKPVRGRGSERVVLARNRREFELAMTAQREFGRFAMVEEFLPGEELTVTVFPPRCSSSSYWALPPVRRFDQINGVAPYNGTIPVTHNSVALTSVEAAIPAIAHLMQHCVHAAELVSARAPIRIDCRADLAGRYRLFDLNMKPNLTGPGRPGRENQDSLTSIAARAIGWSYGELLEHIIGLAWGGESVERSHVA